MSKDNMLDYYRNLYQLEKGYKEDIERELEEYKCLTTMYQDILKSNEKRMEDLKRQILILQKNFTKRCDVKEPSIIKVEIK